MVSSNGTRQRQLKAICGSGSIRIPGKDLDRYIFPEGIRRIHHQRMLDRKKDRSGSQRRCDNIDGIVKRQKVKAKEILQPEPDLSICSGCRDTAYFEQFLWIHRICPEGWGSSW